MTSYANEHDATANSNTGRAAVTTTATATAGTGVGGGIDGSAVMLDSTTPSAAAAAVAADVDMLPRKLHHAPSLEDLSNIQYLDYEYDSSSLSDGREKADTTPENIKKIDDLIEQQQHHNRAAATAAAQSSTIVDVEGRSPHSPQHPVFAGFSSSNNTSAAGLGLAAAVDDSNFKFCLAKPAQPASPLHHACSDKEMIYKGEQQRHLDSSNITPSAAAANTVSYNNNNSSYIAEYNNSDSNKQSIVDELQNSPHADVADSSSNATATTTTTTTTAINKQALSFTIDHFDDKESDPAAQAAKYKSMMERFQSRHRRGASLSKLETEAANKESHQLTSSASANTPLAQQQRQPRNASYNRLEATAEAKTTATEQQEAVKVKLRARDRSTSRVRDAAKRHSWSPRSSTQELSAAPSAASKNAPVTKNASKNAGSKNASQANAQTSPTKRAGKSQQQQQPPQPPKGAANLVAHRSAQFTPRSTAMQLALQKVDFLCAQPPLADFRHLQLEADNISETGTYTLDGDNYTEEQKDLMNIDNKSGRLKRRPKDLSVLQANLGEHLSVSATKNASAISSVHKNAAVVLDYKIVNNNRCSNVLEVNYYHETNSKEQFSDGGGAGGEPQQLLSPRQRAHTDYMLGSHQSAGAYLEQLKARVLRNMCESPPPAAAATVPQQCSALEHEDLGCFTSVTTSGVLAKQSALDPRPKLTRRSSLSTSQIDSSEYVSNETKLQAATAAATAAAYAAGGYTDHQKAEYRLNVFTNQKDSSSSCAVAAKLAATRQLIASPPHTPAAAPQKLSETSALKTAQTKHDWIQEWARNARARSLANEPGGGRARQQQQPLMTRSYTCATQANTSTSPPPNVESLTDDSIYSQQVAAKLHKTLVERHRLAGNNVDECCDYSSDPTLSNYKPPKSPTKIPSPLHSIGRARSSSRSRPPLQQMLQYEADAEGVEEADIFLQKTAAAISNLQQSFSRKNSLRSPTNSASPRAQSVRATLQGGGGSGGAGSALYSPVDGSPQHSLESPTGPQGYAQQQSPRQRQQQQSGYAPRHSQQQRQHHHHSHQQQRYQPPQQQLMTSSFNEQQLQLLTSGDYLMRQLRRRKNSFDGQVLEDGQASPARHYAAAQVAAAEQSLSPLRRSSSYSAKIATNRAARPQYQNIYTPPAARHNYTLVGGAAQQAGGHIKKSASSSNFRQALYSDYDEHLQYYINDADEQLEDDAGSYYSSGAEEEEERAQCYDAEEQAIYYQQQQQASAAPAGSAAPLTHARYNKALLMRIERSKQKVSGGAPVPPPRAAHSRANSAATTAAAAGLVACPNTPELPRRGIKSATSRLSGAATARQSMPRDTSLSRLARQVPNSLANAKQQLLQTAAAGVPAAPAAAGKQRVQPKYLDISKYKPAQGNTFLRKNDAKSTLKQQSPATSAAADAMRRSPSSSSMGLSRADATRMSNRSVRSVTACMTASGTTLGGGGGGGGSRAASAARRDASACKQKEAEMAMWKRRSTYDPMKAAAEDRRKKEEAKRLALNQSADEDAVFESSTTNTRNANTISQQDSLEEEWNLGEAEYDEDEEF